MKSSGGILRCFVNVNMAASHDGLSALAKKYEIDVKRLDPGQFVVFVNGARDRVKVYAANNVIAYQRMPRGERMDLRTISEIPRVFKATGRMNYDDALKAFIERSMARRARAKSPLEVYAAMKARGVV